MVAVHRAQEPLPVVQRKRRGPPLLVSKRHVVLAILTVISVYVGLLWLLVSRMHHNPVAYEELEWYPAGPGWMPRGPLWPNPWLRLSEDNQDVLSQLAKNESMLMNGVQVHPQGCFRINRYMRPLRDALHTDKQMTLEKCMTYCLVNSLPFFGLQDRSTCTCGYHVYEKVRFNDRQCRVPCQGGGTCEKRGMIRIFLIAKLEHLTGQPCQIVRLGHPKQFPLVALASVPGSGNTWLRYLIERATGYYTGSVYRDGELFRQGFFGERGRWQDGQTIAVKTHRFEREHIESFDRVIFLIRNPYHSIVSEHNFKFGGHRGFAPIHKYASEEWNEFVNGKARTWSNMNLNYIQYSKTLLVVYYENLLTNLEEELKRILQFLNINIIKNDKNIQERIQCTLEQSRGRFKREKQQKQSSNHKDHQNLKPKKLLSNNTDFNGRQQPHLLLQQQQPQQQQPHLLLQQQQQQQQLLRQPQPKQQQQEEPVEYFNNEMIEIIEHSIKLVSIALSLYNQSNVPMEYRPREASWINRNNGR